MSQVLSPRVQALYPFQPKTLKTNAGALMSFLDEGPRSDEAVLMLHGNPTWSFYYRNLVSALSPTVRCIVPDHIGMGLSEKPADYPYTLAQRVQDVEQLVASLGLKKLHFVVHDWGGAIGMGVATRNPERIGRIVILNTAAFASDLIPERIAVCRAPFLGALVVRGFNGFAAPAVSMAMAARKLTSAEREGYLAPYDSWSNRVAVHQFVRDIPMEPGHPSAAELKRIENGLSSLSSHPKLLLWGGKDFCFNDAFLERWKQIFPTAPVKRFEKAGHYVLEDSDGEAVKRAAAFLLRGET